MKRSIVLSTPVLATVVLGWASGASAQTSPNKHLCCDLVAGMASGSCVAQPGPCSPKGDFSVDLSNLAASDATDGGAGDDLRPGARDAVFRDGVDGHVFWVTSPPWVGFCLMVPANYSGDVLGCLRVSLSPGVGAASAHVTVPVDSRWGRYQLCYGAPAKDPQNPTAPGSCAGVDDALDPTVTVSSGGSCCAPPRTLDEQQGETWTFGANQEIPGVPPPVIIERPDAGVVAYLDPDPKLGDAYVSISGQQCLPEYDEPPMCGTPNLDGAAPSPTAQVGVNLTTPDGGLSGIARQEAEAGGGCVLGGGHAAEAPGAAALLATLATWGAAAARRRRR